MSLKHATHQHPTTQARLHLGFRRTRHGLIVVFTLVLMLTPTLPISEIQRRHHSESSNQIRPRESASVAEAGGPGSELSSTMFMSRESLGHQISILNTYANTTDHSELLEFAEFQISGWKLYQATMNIDNITAAPEREVVGNSSLATFSNFYAILEYDLDLYYDQLAQGFYNMSHDGQLLNFSILYDSPSYDPGNQNYTYLEVRDDHTDGSTNVTTGVPMPDVGTSSTWMTVSQNALLTADEVYFVVINGSLLGESAGVYPWIRWHYEPNRGTFETWRHRTDGPSWGSDRPFEALVNFTYTPWNNTSNQALVYENPEEIQVEANSTTMTGTSWVFSSSTNVSAVRLTSNQSVFVNYGLSLLYMKDTTSTTVWSVAFSGVNVSWNATSSLSFPARSGILDRGLNLTLPSDWTANGLYNASNPSDSYDNFVQYGSTVTCTKLDNETWTLVCSAPNYVRSLDIFDDADNNQLVGKASIFQLADINSTIESPSSVPAFSGSANLSVFHEGTKVYTETALVANGLAHHQWDIQSYSDGNGVYDLQVYWSNGSEAGYLAEGLIVYYPTELTTAEESINSYTESSFGVNVFFNDTYTPKGLNSSFATVTYSFGAIVNDSMSSLPNGTWTQTLSTAGFDSGTHDLLIYAEGFAFENQSMIIEVTLIHQTQPLTIEWSNDNNITYVQQTQLSVVYRRLNGLNISDAMVNVTIGSDTWNLVWDVGSEKYRITFNGSDALPGMGSFSPAISAWKLGYDNESSTTSLIVRSEPTTLTASWVSNQFEWTESLVLSFEFRDSFGSLIDLASEKLVWINGTEQTLQGDNGTYWIQLDNRFDLGYHNVVANVSKHGYLPGFNDSISFTIVPATTYLTVDWSSARIDYLGRFDLTVYYALASNGSQVPMGQVEANITIDGSTVLDLNQTSIFWTANLTGMYLDLGTHEMVIRTWRYGYEFQTNSTTLTVDKVSTQLTYSWASLHNNNISYIQQTILYINYTMIDGSSIPQATIDVLVDATPWTASWNSSLGMYECLFLGTDDPPGLGTHSVTIEVSKYGYQNQTDSSQITLREAETSTSGMWSTAPPITFVEQTTLIVVYNASDGSRIYGATVTVTLDGQSWPLNWNSPTQDYRIQFNGSDAVPGIGVHDLSVSAVKFGYAQANAIEQLTIIVEPASLTFEWSPDSNITYFESAILTIHYRMNTGSAAIQGAILNVTIGTKTWNASWNAVAGAYQIQFNGSDVDPGLGNHTVSVRAWKYGFWGLLDENETLLITKEYTTILSSWSSPNFDTITYLNSTELRVAYTMANGTAIMNAIVNATDGFTVWNLEWEPSLQSYTIQFNGTDATLGLGSHNLFVSAWKEHFENRTDSETLTIIIEPTSLSISSSDGFVITYVQSTVLIVSYAANDTPISGAIVNVTIGFNTWNLTWHNADTTYRIQFNGTDDPPGLFVHDLNITAWKHGFSSQVNDTLQLEMKEESTGIDFTWIPNSPITYLQSIMLYVNYTMSNGTAIPGANVVVVLGEDSWDVKWNGTSRVYHLQFNGTDPTPGLGTHSLFIWAVKTGYVTGINDTQVLTIQREPSFISAFWDAQSEITYVENTVLYVNYSIGTGSSIEGAILNVTIGSDTWDLRWNSALSLYQIQFNGTDSPPGFGEHNITIRASRWGYVDGFNDALTLIIQRHPTFSVITWGISYGNNITFIEQTMLYANYSMSNATPIEGAQVNVTISSSTWSLKWNDTSKLYQIVFNGSDADPGLDTFDLVIKAWKFGYGNQTSSTTLVIRPEPTTLTAEWIWSEFGWDHSDTLSFEYRDSRGSLIDEASQKLVWVNGSVRVLTGTSGVYSILLSNAFYDLGYHVVVANVSKHGYIPGYNDSAAFSIFPEPTFLTVDWSSSSIDYLGMFNLTVNYARVWDSRWVPTGSVVANITIDSTTVVPLVEQNNYWIANLTGASLGLGTHSIYIQAWGYGYAPNNDSSVLTVNPVPTTLTHTWNPSNVTILYTASLNLTVNYTFYGGAVPTPAVVNVTINGRTFDLTLSSGLWEASIPGSEIGLGVFDATVRAWAPVYESIVAIQTGVNITETPNIFFVDPFGPAISYVETIVFSVTYNYDFQPIIGANVTLLLNGTRPQSLVYNATDEKWHLTLPAADIGLGTWNVTITGNKTGYEPGSSWRMLVVEEDIPILTPSWTSLVVDYITLVTWNMGVDTSDSAPVTDATVWFTMAGTTEIATHLGSGIYYMDVGQYLSIGHYSINVTVARLAIRTTTIFLTLNVTRASSAVQLDHTNSTIYYDESVLLNVSYVMLNGSYIPGAVCSLLVNDTPHPIVWSGNHWEATLDGTNLGTGLYRVEVNVTAYGFESLVDEFYVLVVSIPTYVVVTGQFSDYVNDTIAIDVSYFDGRTSSLIDIGGIIVVWPSTYSTVPLGFGSVSLRPNTGLHVGNYTLNFTLTKPGHIDASQELTIELLPIPTALVVDDFISEYTNETVDVSVYLNDTHNNLPIDWANVILSLAGTEYQMEYRPASQTYGVQIHLGVSIPTGKYTIRVNATAIDCVDAEAYLTIDILPKANYVVVLVLNTDQVTEGETVVATATVTDEGTAVSGVAVRFVFTITPNQGSVYNEERTDTTGADGTAIVSFQVPQGSSQVEVRAEVDVSRTAWGAQSVALVVQVTQVQGNPLLELLGDPMFQLLVVAGAVLGIGGVAVRSRRRRPTAKVVDVESVIDGLRRLGSLEFAMLFDPRAEGHILTQSLEWIPEAYQVRAMVLLSSEGIEEALGLPEEEEISVKIHGMEASVFMGNRMVGVVVGKEGVEPAAKNSLRSLVETFEAQYEFELLDWPKTVNVFETDWRIVGPETSETDRIKAFVFLSPVGYTRAEIADKLVIPVKRVHKLVKGILELESEFLEAKSGRKRLIVYKPDVLDEKKEGDTRS